MQWEILRKDIHITESEEYQHIQKYLSYTCDVEQIVDDEDSDSDSDSDESSYTKVIKEEAIQSYCTSYFLNKLLGYFKDDFFDSFDKWWRIIMIVHRIADEHRKCDYELYRSVCTKHCKRGKSYDEAAQEKE